MPVTFTEDTSVRKRESFGQSGKVWGLECEGGTRYDRGASGGGRGMPGIQTPPGVPSSYFMNLPPKPNSINFYYHPWS